MIPETKKSVAALLDITKRKQAEDELRSEKTFTESALNSLSDVFFVFDLNGKFLRWNKNMNAVLGYSDAEISSMQPVDFFLKEDVRRVLDAIEIALKDGYAGVEARVLTKDGETFHMSSPVRCSKTTKANLQEFVVLAGTSPNASTWKKNSSILRIMML